MLDERWLDAGVTQRPSATHRCISTSKLSSRLLATELSCPFPLLQLLFVYDLRTTESAVSQVSDTEVK
jgi:hypothetical protein